MSKIKVKDIEITVIGHDGQDYISLTDMVKNLDGDQLIKNWLRNKNTIEFLGVWEMINNLDFKMVEFDLIKIEAGTNRFLMSVNQWVEKTGAIGLIAKAGRYGGTYAHKDIAFEFGTWISPEFKLLLIKEFQRLKEDEAKHIGGQWDFRRYVSKVNYKIQTDAVKAVLVPIKKPLTPKEEGYIYTEEADLIYIAMFGFTSKEWRQKNPELAAKGLNIRDVANTHQLIVLANLESINSTLLNAGHTDKRGRLEVLRKQSIIELKVLKESAELQHKLEESPNIPLQRKVFLIEKNKEEQQSSFDNNLKGLLNVPPPNKDI